MGFGNGSESVSVTTLSQWFAELANGPCGVMEDPTEDVFISYVSTKRGGYRIFEGHWESAAFYLQRFLNVVQHLPAQNEFDGIADAIHGMLTLSEMICERSDATRYCVGAADPLNELPGHILDRIPEIRRRVMFSRDELANRGVSLDDLKPFFCDRNSFESFCEASIIDSPLLHQPLLLNGDELIVALPTAISVAIRTVVTHLLIESGYQQALVTHLCQEYRHFFQETPPFREEQGFWFPFSDDANGTLGCCGRMIGDSTAVHLIFVFDDLDGFNDGRLSGCDTSAVCLVDRIGIEVDRYSAHCRKQNPATQGVTFIVGCGIGRASLCKTPSVRTDGWRIVHITAPDIASLSLRGDTSVSVIWSIMDFIDCIASRGIQLLNPYGFFGIIAWSLSSEPRALIANADIPECGLVVPITPGDVKSFRLENATSKDRHVLTDIDGRLVVVERKSYTLFPSSSTSRVYIESGGSESSGTTKRFAIETNFRTWWVGIDFTNSRDRVKMLATWLPRLIDVIESCCHANHPRVVDVRITFSESTLESEVPKPVTLLEVEESITVTSLRTLSRVTFVVGDAFNSGLALPSNVSERGLVRRLMAGFDELLELDQSVSHEQLVSQVVRSQDERVLHGFHAGDYHDYVHESVPGTFVLPHPIVDDALMVSLSDAVGASSVREIEGRELCCDFLKKLVFHLESQLCRELKRFGRRDFVYMLLLNHEAADYSRTRWRRTTRSLLALHGHTPQVLDRIGKHEEDSTAAMTFSRLLIEAALCECDSDSSSSPGVHDLMRIMAIMQRILSFGTWCDTIYYGAMEPRLRISDLGHVQADDDFLQRVIVPFGDEVTKNIIQGAADSYHELFVSHNLAKGGGNLQHLIPDAFREAWMQEFGFSIEDAIRVGNSFEEYGVTVGRAVFELRKSQLADVLRKHVESPERVIDSYILKPRRNWYDFAPPYDDRDRQPWRYGRRLSLVRRPLVQLDDTEDAKVLIAPSIVRQSLIYCFEQYHDGGFPRWQVQSKAMKSWAGAIADRRGKSFTNSVADRLRELGWNCQTERRVKEILRRHTDIDYGDVDVIAWSEVSQRILLIECKHLQMSKLPGELAQQLREYRGLSVEGNRDSLRKHLDRTALLQRESSAVKRHLNLTDSATIESWIVFRYPVPMLFSWAEFETMSGITTYDRLSEI